MIIELTEEQIIRILVEKLQSIINVAEDGIIGEIYVVSDVSADKIAFRGEVGGV